MTHSTPPSAYTVSKDLESFTPVPDLSTTVGKLRHLQTVVRNADAALWNMDTLGKPECGTPGCAYGHARLDKHFIANGLPNHFNILKADLYFGADVSAKLFGYATHENTGRATTQADVIARIERVIAEVQA